MTQSPTLNPLRHEAGPPPQEAPRAGASPGRRFLTFFLAWSAVWWGTLAFFLAPFVPGGAWSVLGAAVVVLLPLLLLGRILTGRLYPTAAVRLFVLRPFIYAQVALPLVGLSAIAAGIVGLPFGAGRAAGAAGAAAAAGAFALLSLVGYLGSRRLVVRRFMASFPDLPSGLEGLRIVQLSDLHVGPHTPRRYLRRVAEAVRAAEPHVLLHTGDQVDDHDVDVAHFGRAFGDLKAPLGVFAIAGNHDIFAGWDGVRKGLEEMGITVLVNEAVPVKHQGAELWVAGTGDPAGLSWRSEGGAGAAPDLPRTLAAVPEGAFTLALAHNPALWPPLAARGIHLTLSGHTHHGQFSIPPLNWSLASSFLDLAMGHHLRGGSILYINPGTNYWGIPFRIGAWPEVTAITLRRGPVAFLPAP